MVEVGEVGTLRVGGKGTGECAPLLSKNEATFCCHARRAKATTAARRLRVPGAATSVTPYATYLPPAHKRVRMAVETAVGRTRVRGVGGSETYLDATPAAPHKKRMHGREGEMDKGHAVVRGSQYSPVGLWTYSR